MIKNTRITIGCPVWILFLGYMILILLADLADLLCYLLGIPQVTILSRCLSFAVWLALIYFIKDKVRVSNYTKSKITPVVVAFFLLCGFVKCVQPDNGYDTLNYHLIDQTAGFIDAFGHHVAPGFFQFFGFQLPDRMFYLFRVLLGYRMGTMLNSLVAILIYLQTRDLLAQLFGTKFQILRETILPSVSMKWKQAFLNEAIIAFFVVLVHDMTTEFGTYLIDTMAVPIGLEMLRILLETEKPSKGTSIYYALLAGLLFCHKMTNIVYMAPLLLLYLYKNRKEIQFSLFVQCFVIAILPVSIYLVYNYAETGNPVFPYFNSVFQSVHYPTNDFKDTRWGPSSTKELLLWFAYMIFLPGYRQSEIPNPWAIGGMGMFVAAFYFLFTAFRKREDKKADASAVYVTFIISYALWAYTTGHIRYFLFGYILGGIIFVDFVLNMYLEYRNKLIHTVTAALALAFVISPVVFLCSIYDGHEWGFRTVNKYDFEDNLQYVLRDHTYAGESQSQSIDMFLLNEAATGGVAFSINENAPIISNYYVNTFYDETMRYDTSLRIKEFFDQGKKICDILYPKNSSVEQYITALTANGLKLVSFEWLQGSLIKTDSIILVTLDELGGGEYNRYYHANGDTNNKMHLKKSSDLVSIEFNAGYTVRFGWYPQDGIFLQVTVEDALGNRISDGIPVKEGEFYSYIHEFDLSGFDDDITVTYNLVYGNGALFDVNGPNKFMVWNPVTANAQIIDTIAWEKQI